MAFVYSTDHDMCVEFSRLTSRVPVVTLRQALASLASEQAPGGWTPHRLAAYRVARRSIET